MEKNNFLIYNDIVYTLRACETLEQMQHEFLSRLKLLIPFSYASIVLSDPENEGTFLTPPLCMPDSFTNAEEEYIRHMDEDHLLWIINGTESNLVRESDLVEEEGRLNSPLYIRCYKKYNIYDTLQYSIIYDHTLLGILTLFRTKIDGTFHDEDMFYLRSLGIHLNVVMHNILAASDDTGSLYRDFDALVKEFGLTVRESQILELVFQFRNNDEIARMLSISENTIQKHLQNLYRKLHVSSKWELLRSSSIRSLP